ncbi:uncharacterized protein LOC128388029 [Panonychus citri]|uniref:uncharacterized protein LOC128388029 n=1 Tax=Panonychus citri TaxID=50023 RepID=UPI002307FEA5|nr:uncharacterized protein LOC128388029 [Panonychus citri]
MDDQQWTLVDTEVTIVNRKKSYQIPKQKLSSIPYFVKLFSDSNCGTTKIELDLDESSFDNIVDFILNDHLSISMESAFSMIETVDYLGMDEIKQKYHDYFQSNFNIKLLEEYLDFYESHKYQEMFTEKKLYSFIAKYFLPISNTRDFLNFSVSLLERILKLKLVVSYEYQIVEAIHRWSGFYQKARRQYLPKLIKFVNFCHLTYGDMQNVTYMLAQSGFNIHTLQFNVHSFHACRPKLCGSDCESPRFHFKTLIAVYEFDENTIEIRRLTGPNLWTKNGRFTRDEKISNSLIVADHIFDIIYDSGRKGIRVDWSTKKFKALKMFGDDNSYYGQIHKYMNMYITQDIQDPYRLSGMITESKMVTRYGLSLSPTRLEFISLGDHLEGICCGHELPCESNQSGFYPSVNPAYYNSDSKQHYYYLPSLDYRQLSSCTLQGPAETRSCFSLDQTSININCSHPEKILYFLTKQDFSLHFLRGFRSKKLDYSFLKSFIGSDSLDHIELTSHNNSVLICNKKTKTIYSHIMGTDTWQFMSEIVSPQKMITIASINLHSE